MNQAVFIDEDYLRRFAPISAAVDTATLWPFVITSQQMDILPLIGRRLHDRLCASIAANAVTDDERELLSLLRDALVWSSLHSYLLFGSVRLRGEGAVRQSGEGKTPASIDELAMLRKEAKSMFYSFAERVKDHLCDNAAKFPEHLAVDRPTASDNGPSMGVYLGKAAISDPMTERELALWRWKYN